MVLIWCPVPLPEDSATALLTRMLTPTPCQVSTGESENKETRGTLGSGDNLDAVFGKTETSLPEGKDTEGAHHGKKRAAPEDQEGEVFQERKNAIDGRLGPGKRCCRRAL